MHPHTLDFTLAFGYGGKPYEWTNRATTLQCSYRRAAYVNTDFKKEVERTITLLAAQASGMGRRPRLLLSGGLDSQIIAATAIGMGIDLHPVALQFAHSLNDHEMEWVYRFADDFNTKVEIVSLDVEDWLMQSATAEALLGCGCSTLETAPHLYLMDYVWAGGGMPILGAGDPYVALQDDGSWHYTQFEEILTWTRHAIRRGIFGGINFFQHTPEVFLSMLLASGNDDLYDNRLPGKVGNRSIKYEMYHRLWPMLAPRPKYNGGEKMKAIYDVAIHETGIWEAPFYRGRWSCEVREFIRRLMPDVPN